jgi:hypothetical protein
MASILCQVVRVRPVALILFAAFVSISFSLPATAGETCLNMIPAGELRSVRPGECPYTIDVNGELAVVGAQWHDNFRGAAYVLRRSGERWVLEQTLVQSGSGPHDHFGGSVSIDGGRILVGASWHGDLKGTIFIFEREGGVWVEKENMASDDARASIVEKHVQVDQDLIDIVAQTSLDLGEPASPPAPPALDAPSWVEATDFIYEDRTEVTWEDTDQDAIIYKVLRNGSLLSVVSSNESKYVDRTGVLGATYDYCVVVEDMYETETAPVCDSGGRRILPPAAVSASDGLYTDRVEVTWLDISLINTGYSIYRDGSPLGTAGPGAGSFRDTSAVPLTNYTYSVTATFTGGYESVVVADGGWRGTIMPPASVRASDGQYLDRIVITWQDQAPDELGYRIYRDDTLIDSTGVDTEAYEDTTVMFNAAYEYCVATIGTGYDESARICDTGRTGLAPPGNVSASDSTFDDRIQVTWEDLSNLETGYEISRSVISIRHITDDYFKPDPRFEQPMADDNGNEILDTLAAGAELYNDFSAQPGIIYNYFVRAINSNGGASPSENDTGLRSHVLAPYDVEATDGDFEDRTLISWESSSTTAVLFKILRDGQMIKTVSSGDRYYNDRGGVAGQEYDYSVVAMTAQEIEAASLPDAGRRELNRPTYVSATDEQYERKTDITWTDNSYIEVGYHVYRAAVGGTDSVLVVTLPSNRATYTDMTGQSGVTYRYSVAAFDTVGGTTADSPVSCNNGGRLINPPTNVQATDGLYEDRVEISWVDNSDAEDGYYVYRDTTFIGSSLDNVTYFVDNSPKLGAPGLYSVAAFDLYGASESVSDNGEAIIFDPVSFNASDVYSYGVELTWIDVSQVEEGYRIYKDGVPLVTLSQPNITSYNDEFVSHAVLQGSQDTPDSAMNVYAMTSSYYQDVQFVYVADGNAGVQAIVVSERFGPLSINLTGSCDTPGFAWDIVQNGDFLYVADGTGGLSWMSIHEYYEWYYIESRLAFLGNIDLPGTSKAVAVAGSFLYVAGKDMDLRVFDISQANNPQLVDSIPGLIHDTRDLLVYSDLLIISDGDYGIKICDISDPSSPIPLSTYDSPGTASACSVLGDYLYVADGSYGLQVLGISDPEMPSSLGSCPLPGVAMDVAVQGIYAYVSAYESGLHIVSIIDPANPQLIMTNETSGPSAGLGMAGGFIFAAVIDSGMQVFRSEASGIGGTHTYCVKAYSGEAESIGDVCDEGSQPISESFQVTTRLQASDGSSYDLFGYGVATNGAYSIVSAKFDDDYGNNSGSVYVFKRGEDGTWMENQKLNASDQGADDEFGRDIDMCDDALVVGSVCFYGEPIRGGGAYIFRLTGDTWVEEAKLTASDVTINKLFGFHVGIDGDRVIVSCDRGSYGKIYFFHHEGGGVWTETHNFPVSYSGDVSISGDYAIAGSNGAAYIFEYDGLNWNQVQMLTPRAEDEDSEFGKSSVSISGNTAFVGAYASRGETGAAYIYKRSSDGTWYELHRAMATDNVPGAGYGYSAEVHGNSGIIGSPYSSAAYLLRSRGNIWTESQKLVPFDSPSEFSTSADISNDALIFGSTSEAAYIMNLFDTPDSQVIFASDGDFDSKVSITWTDAYADEAGFRIYRDGGWIDETGPDVESYSDVDGQPGRTYEYRISVFYDDDSEVDIGTDYGWKPLNGVIGGRITSIGGDGIDSVQIRLEPSSERALLFDGASGYVIVGDAVAFDFTSADSFTVEAWIKYSGSADSSTSDGTILAKTRSSLSYPFLLRTDHSSGCPGRLVFSLSDGVQIIELPTVRTDLNDNRWHHVSCVHDPTKNAAFVYVDGLLDSAVVYSALGDITSDDDLYFGDGSPGVFSGIIDEVRIWNRVLSDIDVYRFRDARLEGNEAGLTGYWPFNESYGLVVTDYAGQAQYGRLELGVYRTENSAPIRSYALSDDEGNYVMDRVFYGEATAFSVIPSGGQREFQPSHKTVTLSTGNPVENLVDFIDITMYVISGSVTYSGTGCPVAEADIFVDGELKGSTDKNGKYSLSVDGGERTFEVVMEGHSFSPEKVALDVSEHMAINYSDTTKCALSGRVSGGCDRHIGEVSIFIRSENGCLTDTLVTDSTYSVSLPPMAYYISGEVNIDSIPPGLIVSDVLDFFNTLGEREVDLTSVADTVLDFTYRAPLQMRITGFEPYISCGQLVLEDETPLPDSIPIVSQMTEVVLEIEVNEDYGNGVTCPLDTGLVRIYDELIEMGGTAQEVPVSNGVARYVAYAAIPSFVVGRQDSDMNDRSYQKSVTAVAVVEGKDPVSTTTWVLVTGHLAPEGTEFVTFTTDELPLYVLRDPCGDNSYAFLEDGYTSCSVIDFDIVSASLGLDIDYQFKWGFDKTFFIGFGGGVILNVKGEAVLKDKWKFDWNVSRDQQTEICLTTNEKFSTSQSDLFIGENGDVFVGAGLNFLFARVNTLSIEDCVVKRGRDVGVEPDGFATAFSYTEQHIRESLIPDLLSISEYYTAIEEFDSASLFEGKADNWQFWLDENRRYKSEAVTSVNRSFSAGADFEFSHKADTISSFSGSTTFRLEHEFMTGSSFDIFGASKLEFLVGYHSSYQRILDMVDTTGTATQVIGYVLSDDDIGDNFTVDIKDDGYFPSPVFDVLGGVSSCPWEPWYDAPDTGQARMVSRDGAMLLIENPEVSGVPADGAAVFKLTLVNNSGSDETREYHLRAISASNPDGAIIKVNGAPITNGLSYFLEPGEAQEVTMTVERGPERYTYDDLKVFLYPPCEYDNWENGGALQCADTVSFSAGFVAPCSDITMMLPEEGWSLNLVRLASDDSLLFLLKGYDIDVGEPDEGFTVQYVGAQFRYVGQGEETAGLWYDIIADSLGRDETLMRWLPPDTLRGGMYELRGFAHCDYGRGYSESVNGIIDFEAPFVFGPPQPSDEDLSFGEFISLTFSEQIDCRTVDSDSIVLTYAEGPFAGDTIDCSASCDGRTIIISCLASSNALEGLRLEASVRGICDMAGNPMERPVTWQFVWNRSRFVWSSRSVSSAMTLGSAVSISGLLVNGTDETVDWTISGVPAWIAEVSPPSGSIAKGGTQEISFEIRDDIGIGSYQATISSEAADPDHGVALIDVSLDVTCGDPGWIVDPGDFEYTMPVVAVLDIGGSTSEDTADRVAAFVGSELRGTASVVHLPLNPDPYLVFLTTYSNRPSGETLRFEIWDADSCRLYNWTEERYQFNASSALGSPVDPLMLTASELLADTVLAIEVDEGWNWVSTNIASADMSVGSVLSSVNAIPGDLIKSSTQFSQFVDSLSGWTGSLVSLDNVSGYLLHLSESGTILHAGTPADEAVPVQRGWNWIGYLPRGPVAVVLALDDLAVQNIVEDGDIVKSQDAFAIYDSGSWIGSLTGMEPGKGYKIYLAGASETPGVDSFVYPEYTGSPPPAAVLAEEGTAASGADAVSDHESDGSVTEAGVPSWTADCHAFQYNMTLTAVLRIQGLESIDGNDMIGAFSGDMCRGVANPVYVPGTGRYLVFMMIYTDDISREEIGLRAFDADAGVVYDINETVTCRCDAMLGSVHYPVILNTGAVHDDQTPGVPSAFALGQNYPNPFNPSTEIRYDVPKDGSRVSIRIYDVAGRLVRILVDQMENAGSKSVLWDGLDNKGGQVASSVYFYRMDAPGFERTRKMVLLR